VTGTRIIGQRWETVSSRQSSNSHVVEDWQPTYALLQKWQISLEITGGDGPEPQLKHPKLHEIIKDGGGSVRSACEAAEQARRTLDGHRPAPTGVQEKGFSDGERYRKVWVLLRRRAVMKLRAGPNGRRHAVSSEQKTYLGVHNSSGYTRYVQ